MNNIYMLILGMMIVTYLPRFLPLVLMNDKKIPPKLEEFLSYIPYAALGALIIPGFITAIPGHALVSFAGVIAALVLGYFNGKVVIPVLGAICTCMVLINLGI